MPADPGNPALHWSSSSRTDVGMVRQHNEDACLDRPEAGLWAVADGMGGHSAGDVASAMIVQRLQALDPAQPLSRLVDQAEEILAAVNAELRQLAANREAATIGSTVVALIAHDAHAVCLWAGDSRAYRLRDGVLEQVTQDHALVADLVDRGVLSAEQAANHPQSNLVTRAVGAGDTLKLDLEIMRLRPGDRFILCSDGLDKELRHEEIRELLARGDGAGAANALVELALSRGSRDNVTVVAVQIDGEEPDATAGEDELVDADSEDTLPGFTVSRRAGAPRIK
jgi:serine/threonine protein phosphatase PrpC